MYEAGKEDVKEARRLVVAYVWRRQGGWPWHRICDGDKEADSGICVKQARRLAVAYEGGKEAGSGICMEARRLAVAYV